MSKSPAKYVVVKNGKDLVFQRKIPKRIVDKLNLESGKVYMRSLSLTLGCSDTELSKAIADSQQLFELHCKRLENSSPQALSDSQLDLQLTELLRKFNLRAGQFIGAKDKAAKINKAFYGHDDGQIGDIFRYDEISKDKTIDEEYSDWEAGLIKAQAESWRDDLAIEGHDAQLTMRLAEKLTEAEKHAPKTLGGLINEYFYRRGFEDKQQIEQDPDPTKQRIRRNNKRTIARIKTLFALVGEQYANDQLGEQIQFALKQYCYKRLEGNKVAVSTVKRELVDIKSFLNYCIEEYGYRWNIKTPNLQRIAGKDAKPKRKKQTLTIEHQKKLVDYILNYEHGDHKCAVMCLLYLLGGVMPSETAHMTLDNGKGFKNSRYKTPYLNANYKHTKTNARKRLVPVVIGARYIREHLEETTEWLSKVSDSSSYVRIKKFLEKATGTDAYTGHCLRHTFKYNFTINQADIIDACMIAGWDTGKFNLSRDMLDYGMEGMETQKAISKIYKTSQVIHKHLKKYFNK